MTEHLKAQTLEEISRACEETPLQSGDPRYADLSGGRTGVELELLRAYLQDCNAKDNRFASAVFVGHRGSGKTTELHCLIHDLQPRFTCLHLPIDQTLLRDCDYPELFLWLVDALVRKFSEIELDLNPANVEEIARWFADKSVVDVDTAKAEVSAETEAEAEAKAGVFWLSLKILARVKAKVLGSSEERRELRRKVQNYSDQLISGVNRLLGDAQNVLERADKSPDLLVILDDMDRIDRESGIRLFCENGSLLQALDAHVVYTAPLAMLLAPHRVAAAFENSFTMPMVKVTNRDGSQFPAGRNALKGIIAKRVNIDKVFSSQEVVYQLADYSGGNVRDLMRLLRRARLLAQVYRKERIDAQCVQEAVKKMRLDYERMLLPGNVYYPLLAQIHLYKELGSSDQERTDPESMQDSRTLFRELLFNCSVMEYNGEESWYDVHPVVREIEAFKNALAKAKSERLIQ